MIEHSLTISELIKGLHGAQGKLTGVARDRTNPHFRNKYATLEAVLDTARPALQAHGLAVTQAPGRVVDGCIEITTMLMHTSGEWIRSTLHVPLVKKDPQGLGSATTYGLRYALMAALGVPPTDDDDGNGAMPDRRSDQGRPNQGRIEVTSGSTREHADDADPVKDEFITACRQHIIVEGDPARLREWWTSEAQRKARREFGLTQDEVDSLKTSFSDRLRAIGSANGHASREEARH